MLWAESVITNIGDISQMSITGLMAVYIIFLSKAYREDVKALIKTTQRCQDFCMRISETEEEEDG